MLYDITCMWHLKYNTDELICETEPDSDAENRQVVAEGEGGWIWSLGLADANRSIQSG